MRTLGRLGAVLACLPAVALAAKLQLSPLSLALKPGQKATTITLRNEDVRPVTVQVRVFHWSQDAVRGMLLQPTTAIAMSPPQATLAPGATQIIRLAHRSQEQAAQEQSFRVLIDELPAAGENGRTAVRMLTRYSLPLFIEPSTPGMPQLSASMEPCQEGGHRILIDNAGQRRARIANWRLLSGTDPLAAGAGLAGYALHGSQLAIPLTGLAADAGRTAGDVRLTAETDLGVLDLIVVRRTEAAVCTPAAGDG